MTKRRFPLTLALTAFALSAAIASAQNVLTPHDVSRLRAVTGAVISPAGDQVAYTMTNPRRPFEDEEGAAWGELHILGRDGKSRGYVTGEVNVGEVAWRPSKNTVTFLAKRGKDEFRSLYEISPEGGEARRILTHSVDIGSYSWSPDGNRVAFLANEPESEEKKTIEKKGFRVEIYEETARPVRLWTADLTAATVKPVAVAIEGSGSNLRWSPDGSKIALAIAPTSRVDEEYTSRKVTILDAAKGTVLATIPNHGKLGDFVWSPSGQYLAVVAALNENDPSAGRLYIASADGSSFKELIANYEGDFSDVAWRNDQTLVVLSDVGTATTLFEIQRDGSKRRQLIGTESATVFTSIDGAPNGRLSLLGESPSHPTELFTLASGTAAPVRVTDSNPWLKDERLAKQEVVRYKARDGVEIEGLLIRPLDEKAGTRYPLILTVHGGPEAHWRNGWLTSYSNPGQVAAARGMAVFYQNYRGSTGRGHLFSTLSQGDPAGKEFDDLVDGIDHLVGTGLVDKAKVGITGGSYGGYATAWGVTYYSDRFAAGVMFVGISDTISKWGTTDIPGEEFMVHARKQIWDDWNFFRERSPIYHAGRSKTPTLILHGKDDPRVHPSQSMELYRHLKARSQAPVRLVLYPGEGHGNRRAGSRLDYNLRMMQWFEHYLKGAGGAMPAYQLQYGETAK